MNKQILNKSIQDVEMSRKIENIKQFGTHSMSYSALQNGVKEFRYPSFKGFIPYSSVWGVDYVLSDPITSKSEMLKATVVFKEKHKHAVFCQISKDYAKVLSQLKLTINGFGVEHMIDLQNFKVSWKRKKCLKSYLSKLNNQKYFVFECNADSEKVWNVNNQWLNGKQGAKELRFMARPFISTKEQDVRYFYMVKDKHLIGFCTFDPVYTGKNSGEINYYTLQHVRVSDRAPLGSQDFLILNALFQFKEEGFENLSLGLSPLYKRRDDHFRSSVFADKIFSFMYQKNLFYNYRTIGQHKDHYKADNEQTYLAVTNKFTLKNLSGLLKVNNLI